MLNKCIRRFFFLSRAKEAKKQRGKKKITPDLRLDFPPRVTLDNVSVKSSFGASTSLLGIPWAFDTFAVPGKREFDYQSLPVGGEFDSHALGVGNLNCTLDFM